MKCHAPFDYLQEHTILCVTLSLKKLNTLICELFVKLKGDRFLRSEEERGDLVRLKWTSAQAHY